MALGDINITVVGRMLRRSWTLANRANRASDELSASPLQAGGEDTCWWLSYERDRARRRGACRESFQSWCERVRAARCADERVFVIIHLFGGKRRPQGCQELEEASWFLNELQCQTNDAAIAKRWREEVEARGS